VFDKAIEELEDSVGIKRQYAPYLANTGDHDRALDFYEDCLEAMPNDPGLMFEYAQALVAADRAFEAPRVLRDLLNMQLEPNLAAQVNALLVEVDQPKRAEAVKLAAEQLEKGDAAGAIRDLKPLTNWLADYWKLWAVLANAYNQADQATEAEQAALRLINIFPNCEPGYIELANALLAQGKSDESYSALAVALQTLPGSVPIGINLALAAYRSGRNEEAKALARQLKEAVASNPDLAQMMDGILDDTLV
jgi:tetratricopeptide (TPR) repeat protein